MSDTEYCNMSDAQESSRGKKRISEVKGDAIFGKYDYTKSNDDSIIIIKKCYCKREQMS